MVEEIEEPKNKGGAPLGNQNARKHGFYSRALKDGEKADFEDARDVEGIDEEIALLRVKIKSLVEYDPQNIQLIMRAVEYIGRLIRIKNNISKNDKKGLLAAVGNVLKDIILPAGMTIGSIVKKG